MATTAPGSRPTQLGQGLEVRGAGLDGGPYGPVIHPAAMAGQQRQPSKSRHRQATLGHPMLTSADAVMADTAQVRGRRRTVPTTS